MAKKGIAKDAPAPVGKGVVGKKGG